ncbi:MAG: hypothetical protein FJ303_13635 [Planctomycetes bacterium]|nr:hypothetical protein [Planctomycetota bacterium]
MEKWRRVWREGLAPNLPVAGLLALERALRDDDPRLLQGVVSTPPPFEAVRNATVTSCCAICYCGWKGDRLRTVGEVEAFYHRICESADAVFSEAAACRFFLNWYDATPRYEMRHEMLGEVRRTLARRTPAAA